MNKNHVVLLCLLTSLSTASCIQSTSAKAPVMTSSAEQRSDSAVATSSPFLAMNVAAIEHHVALARAAAKRNLAQDRCFGMVGGAKSDCLSAANEIYGRDVRLAEIQHAVDQVSLSRPQ